MFTPLTSPTPATTGPSSPSPAGLHASTPAPGVTPTAKNSGRRLRVLSDTLTVLVSGAETEGRFSLFLVETPPGSATPPHLHEHEAETFRILDGLYRFEIDGKTVIAGPGTTLHAAPGVRHAFAAEGTTPARMLVVSSPGGLETFFGQLDRMATEQSLTPESLLAACRDHGIRLLDAPAA